METNNCFELVKELTVQPEYTRLVMPITTFTKLMCYINLVGDYEVSGFGRIVKDKIVDIAVIPQTVGKATASINEVNIAKFIRDIPRNQLTEWKLDWHSHVDFDTSPSGTDISNYKQYKELRNKQFPYLIINKYCEYTCNTYINEYRQPHIELIIEKKQLSNQAIQDIYNKCEADVQKLVQKKVVVPKYNNTLYFKGGQKND